MTPQKLKVGDRVKVLQHWKYAGRTGYIKRFGSEVFPDSCDVVLDPKPRERTVHQIFINVKLLTYLRPKTNDNEL